MLAIEKFGHRNPRDPLRPVVPQEHRRPGGIGYQLYDFDDVAVVEKAGSDTHRYGHRTHGGPSRTWRPESALLRSTVRCWRHSTCISADLAISGG